MWATLASESVAIHNKNGKGLLLSIEVSIDDISELEVAIHNKNGKGLLRDVD